MPPFGPLHRASRCSVITVLVAMAWLGAGCTHPAIVRFANEFDCPREQVELEDLGARTYRVSGCSSRATYVCDRRLGRELCVYDEAPSSGGSRVAESEEARPPADSPGIASGRLQVDGVEVPAIRLVVGGLPVTFAPQPGSEPPAFIVAVTTAYAGQAARCSTLELRADTQLIAEREPEEGVRYRVAADALQAVSRADALQLAVCQRTGWMSRPQREAIAAFATSPSEPTTSEQASSSSSPDPNPAARIRAALDQRREALLACTDRPVMGVRVRWEASGRVSVSLNGELSGSPEEDCLRSQLESLALHESDDAGELVHVLSR